MKKLIVVTSALLHIAVLPSAAMASSNFKSVEDAGMVMGHPGFKVNCKSTSRTIKIYKTANGWHRPGKGLMNTKIRKWTAEEVGKSICNSL